MNKTLKLAPAMCPRCGCSFGCGLMAGEAQCWCQELNLSKVPSEIKEAFKSQGCLCRFCLEELVALRSNNG